VAEDQERRLALLPALVDVRAARLLADGVEVEAAHDALEVAVVRARLGLHLQPGRLALDGTRGLRATDRVRDVRVGDRRRRVSRGGRVSRRDCRARRDDRQVETPVPWVVIRAGHLLEVYRRGA